MDSFSDINWGDIAVKAGYAILILVATWLIAKLVKTAFAKLATKVPALQKAGKDGQTMGASLGTIASLVVWLFGLVAVLQVFSLDGVLSPITGMLEGILGFLPNLIGAAFVFFIGMVIARIVGQLIETSLNTVNFGKLIGNATKKVNSVTDTPTQQRPSGSQFPTPPQGQATPTQQQQAQPAGGPGGQQQFQPHPANQQQHAPQPARAQSGSNSSIPSTVAKVVQALIMIVVAIAALQILNIESISRPAEQMLTTIFDAIPNIIAAGIILAIGVVIARFASDLLGQLLDGMQIDKGLHNADILPADKSATPTITKIIQIAIILFFAVMATQMLGFPQITHFLSEVLALGGKVLFGAAIVAAGVFIANLLAKTISGNTAQVVRYATIILFAAMGLKYMGVADSIIELAFGALVVGGAIAAALAFGLGGREFASRQLKRFEDKRDSKSSS